MAQFFDMLVYLRKRAGLSQQQLADALGMTRSAISMYETGKREPDLETLEIFADFFNVDMNTLTGNEKVSVNTNENPIPPGFQPTPPFSRVPRVGRIACGDPITAEQNIEGYDEVPKVWRSDFTLICSGDSMVPKIQDGDIVAIRKQEEVNNGEIAAVRIGDEATLKYVFLHADYIELRPANPSYESIIRRKDDMNDVRIEGKAVGFFRDLE